MQYRWFKLSNPPFDVCLKGARNYGDLFFIEERIRMEKNRIMKSLKIVLIMLAAVLVVSATAPASTITHAGPETFVGTTPDKVDLIGDLGKTGIDIGIEGSISFDYQFSAAAYFDVMVYAEQGADWSMQIRTNNGSGWHIEIFHWDGASNSSALPANTWDIATAAHDLTSHSFSMSWTDGGTIDLLVDGGATVSASNSYAGVGAGILPGITDLILLGGSPWNPGDAEEYDGTISNIVISDTIILQTVLVVHSSGSTEVTEGGANDTFTVELAFAPTDTVTITLDPNTNDIKFESELPGDPYDLTFTPGDWDTPQTVLVAANDDAIVEDSEEIIITVVNNASVDPNFNNASVLSFPVSVFDNDTPEIIIDPNGTVDVNEGDSSTDTYTVVLNGMPTAAVTVDLVDESATDQVTVSSAQLTFTTGDWFVPQTVTVEAIDDNDDEQPDLHMTTISHTASSADLSFEGLVTNVTVNITDDDEFAIVIAETGGSTEVAEPGSSDTYTVVLSNYVPTADVTVDITDGANPDQVTISPVQLTFTSGDWDTPQTVTVTAIDDAVGEAGLVTPLSHVASSADLGYNGLSKDLSVTVTDDDQFFLPIIDSYFPETKFGTPEPNSSEPGSDPIDMGDIDIMQEGTFSMDFKVPVWTGNKTELLWGYVDPDYITGEGDRTGEGRYSARLLIESDGADPKIQVSMFDQGDMPADPLGTTFNTVSGSVFFPNDGQWHTLKWSWKLNETVVFWIDDTESSDSIQNPYRSANGNANIDHGFSAPGTHQIGDDPQNRDGNGNPLVNEVFTGWLRNVLISDVHVPLLRAIVVHSGPDGATEVSEEGSTSDSFTVELANPPANDVTLTLRPDTNDVALESELPGVPIDLTFTSGNWSVPQTVSVTANDDDIAEDTEGVLISMVSDSTDVNYGDTVTYLPVVVLVQDNDIAYYNFLQFSEFAVNWEDPNACGSNNVWCDGYDFNESGTVDQNDLETFSGIWLDPVDPNVL
jgi:hypothetical protein